ncbi:MAG: hypothetical protein JOZ52_11020 [Acidobacteria bacterium]|nr:hypothetical protein [Acidobacteriota bacterium]
MLTVCGAILLFSAPLMAQSARLSDLADRLAEQSSDLANASYRDYTNNSRNSRAEVEAVFQDQQLGSSAELFRRMVRDRRSRSELQEATTMLSDLARRADRYNRQRSLVNDIQRTISDIQRDLNFGGGGGIPGGGGFPGGQGGYTSGSMRWRGTVDDTTQIKVQESNVEVSAISGTPNSNNTYNFTSPLPYRRVNVRLSKIRGRGDIRIIQQPSRDNDFTTVIEIRDPNRGPDDYEFEISW